MDGTENRADRPMSLQAHLDELRRRVLIVLFGWLLLVFTGFYFAGPLLEIITVPVEDLAILSPGEGFLTHLRLAVVTATALAAPLLLYHLVAFIRPALSPLETRALFIFLPLALVLFIIGGAFGYLLVLPYVLRFFLSFTGPNLQTVISVGNYVSFVTNMVVPFGIVFQLPAVAFVLARVGVVNAALLRRVRKYAVFGILLVSAILTPPDVVSQIMLAIPMMGLYELGIWLASIGTRARHRAGDGL